METVTETKETSLVVNEDAYYHLLDSLDAQQMILDAEKLTSASLIYEVKNQKSGKVDYEPTFEGWKILVQLMTKQLKEPLHISPDSFKFAINKFFDPIEGIDREAVTCTMIIKNETTGLEIPAVAEEFLLMKVHDVDQNGAWLKDEKGNYVYHWKFDEFAQRKARSKALRNGWSDHVPVTMKQQLIQIAKTKQRITKVTVTEPPKPASTKDYCACPVPRPNPTSKSSCMTCKKGIMGE